MFSLTTGSKELAAFAVPGTGERCYPRVLPTQEVLAACARRLGCPATATSSAMQGPLLPGAERKPLIQQFDIR